MYDAVVDPYCYPRTTVLINKLGIRDQSKLDAFEAEITMQRANEPLPGGRLSLSHYKSIHRHFFQDVYAWAGKVRTIRIAKNGNMFCYPEHIDSEMRKLFIGLRNENFFQALKPQIFASKASHFLAELNAIHPFREGNGRAQLAFTILLAERAEHPLALDGLDPENMIDAMITSFGGREGKLTKLIQNLLRS